MAYSSVVVGTDGSATAERAVRAAAELTAGAGAELLVVCSYASEPGPDDPGPRSLGSPIAVPPPPDDRRARAEQAAERGRALAAEAGVEAVVARAQEGVASHVLLAAAREVGADLIVVGSRGMSGPARFTIGSVAGAVSHEAPCDVLIFHTTG